MAPDDLPFVHPTFVDALKKRFPVPVPSLDDSDRAIWHRLGAWSVVQFIERIVKEQQERATRVQSQHPEA
jgi:hypothetical protein